MRFACLADFPLRCGLMASVVFIVPLISVDMTSAVILEKTVKFSLGRGYCAGVVFI
jgi:hypothetical protein